MLDRERVVNLWLFLTWREDHWLTQNHCSSSVSLSSCSLYNPLTPVFTNGFKITPKYRHGNRMRICKLFFTFVANSHRLEKLYIPTVSCSCWKWLNSEKLPRLLVCWAASVSHSHSGLWTRNVQKREKPARAEWFIAFLSLFGNGELEPNPRASQLLFCFLLNSFSTVLGKSVNISCDELRPFVCHTS